MTKLEASEFQKRTIDRIANYVYDLEDNLGDVGMDLTATKAETSWLLKAIEVELEGIVAIVEEYHGI